MTDPSTTPDVLPGPGVSPGFLLWRTTLRWQRRITVALKPFGLTHVQFVMLASTWWLCARAPQGGPGHLPSQRDLADHAGTDVMMTSQVLRALESKGLVSRDPDPRDARVRRLRTTAAGEQLAEQTVRVVEAADAAFFAVTDASSTLDLLHRLLAADSGDDGHEADRGAG